LILGRSLDNSRQGVLIKLINDRKKVERLIKQSNFKHCTTCDEILIPMLVNKSRLLFNKLIYLGMCI